MSDLKIIFAGLDSAGKSSIIYSLDKDSQKLAAVTPTLGVEHSATEVKLLGLKVYRWDLGGERAQGGPQVPEGRGQAPP